MLCINNSITFLRIWINLTKALNTLQQIVFIILIKMGQQEVYDFLKNHKAKWYTSKEIASKLRASQGSVTTCLKKLRDSFAINFEYKKSIGSTRKNAYVYKFKN